MPCSTKSMTHQGRQQPPNVIHLKKDLLNEKNKKKQNTENNTQDNKKILNLVLFSIYWK